MSRPRKIRRVGFIPNVCCFGPFGIPKRKMEEINLTVDETEALRLKDLFGFTQEEAAKKMKVSRITFQRMLISARKKASDALVNCKAINIKGGDFKMVKEQMRKFKCEECQNKWEVPFGTGKRGIEMECPKCKCKHIHRTDKGGHGCGRQPWGYKARGKCK
jgi:predicted DNA-binding protein (UPF0251 family)